MIETGRRIAVISLSGGLDSTSLLLHLLARKATVHGISFDYGQKHRIELARLQANLQYLHQSGYGVEHRLVDLTSLQDLLHSALTSPDQEMPVGHYEQENMRQTVVPNRNAIFASIAYGYALSIAKQQDGKVQLAMGVHAGDHAIYPDCRPEFYQAIHEAFQLGNWDSELVDLYLPYLHDDKFQILVDGQESCRQLGVDFGTVFGNTLTSYAPDSDGRSNGMTGSDVERILAFHRLGIPDPIDYRCSWEQAVSQALQMEREHRASQIKE